jgi:chromate transporter
LCGFFTRTAFVTLGGSYTVVPYVAQVAVVKYGWLTKSQMLDGFALAETTPGPLIIVVAFVGFMAGFHHFHGSFALGTVALLLTCFYTFLPCFLFVFLGAPWVSRSNGNSFVKEILQMITAVVVAAIVQLTIFLVRGVLLSEGSVGWRNIKWWAVVEIIGALLLLYLSSVRRPRR